MNAVSCAQRRLRALAGDLSALTFAKVTRVVLKPEHVVAGEGEDTAYRYFYGFSSVLGSDTTVFFKAPTYAEKLFVGPVQLRRKMPTKRHYPVRGDIIMGDMTNDDGRCVFTWWVHGMRPMYQFRERIFGKIRCRRITQRVRDELRFDARAFDAESSDRLWMLFRLVAFHDRAALDDLDPEARLRFLWLTAAWLRDPLFFERTLQDPPSARYSAETLQRFLAFTGEENSGRQG